MSCKTLHIAVCTESGRTDAHLINNLKGGLRFHTVRRRLQMQSEKPQEEWVYKGTMDCFGKIAAEEGVGALFKGAGANALRTVGSALVLVMYGELKGILAGAAGK